MKIAVVIPALNAADTVGAVVRGITAERIYVVDDGSKDKTAAVAMRAGATVIRHASNRGVGAAMITGYRAALKDGADVIVKMDADGQMDPAFMPALVAGADFAKGCRYHTLFKIPPARALGNLFLSWLTGVEDAVNGYTAIRAETLKRIDYETLGKGYFFEISLLLRLKRRGIAIENIPMPARYGEEKSHVSIWRYAIQFPWLFLREKWL
jgi:glycosyltransferase involved in cell wall biosynthesis